MDKPLEHQVKAMRIYNHIRIIKKDATERLRKQGFFDKVEKEIWDFIKKEKIDTKTTEILKHLFKKESLGRIDEMELRMEEMIDKLSVINNGNQADRILLTLTDNGNLYQNADSKKCYSIKEGSRRLKIIKMLIGTGTFCKTKILSEISNCSNKDLSTDIKKINTLTQKFLKLSKAEDHKLIISKRGSGYSINSLYVIQEKG